MVDLVALVCLVEVAEQILMEALFLALILIYMVVQVILLMEPLVVEAVAV
jgi:hypothetical protein